MMQPYTQKKKEKKSLVSMWDLIGTHSRLFYVLIGLIFMVLCIRKLLVSSN
jgi:hypothetical protein